MPEDEVKNSKTGEEGREHCEENFLKIILGALPPSPTFLTSLHVTFNLSEAGRLLKENKCQTLPKGTPSMPETPQQTPLLMHGPGSDPGCILVVFLPVWKLGLVSCENFNFPKLDMKHLHSLGLNARTFLSVLSFSAKVKVQEPGLHASSAQLPVRKQ